MNFRADWLFCPRFIAFQIHLMITTFFIFYIQICLIGILIPELGECGDHLL